MNTVASGLVKKLLNVWFSSPASCPWTLGLQAGYHIPGSRILNRNWSTSEASVGSDLVIQGDCLEKPACLEEAT